MKKVILDTNFILSCVKQKIDFLHDLKFMGFKIIIPKQVIDEIKMLEKRRKIETRESASLALKMFKKNKKDFRKIDFRDDKVDRAMMKFMKRNKNDYIATLDRELKEKTKNHKIVIRNMKKLEVV